MHGMYGGVGTVARTCSTKGDERVVKIGKRKLDHIHVYLENQNLWCGIGAKVSLPQYYLTRLGAEATVAGTARYG